MSKPPSPAASPEQAPPAALSLEKTPAAPQGPAASSFAPFVPAPPAPAAGPVPGFGGAGGPAPANPWAQHGGPGYAGYGYGGPGYPTYAQPGPATGNGLAVSAAIVGGFGILIGLVPLLFWLGFILGLTAIGLGIGAIVRASKGAPQKTLSIVGTVLGVLALVASVGGLFLTALVFDEAADRRAQDRRQQRLQPDGLFPSRPPSASPKPTKPSQVPGLTSPLPFGETFTYDNGVKVSLSAPKEYEPKGVLARESKNPIQITVTITNGSAEPYEVLFPMPSVRDEQGETAKVIYDGSAGVPKVIRGSIMPGQSASGVVAFDLPDGTKNITADISPGLVPSVKYTGPIG
ncbi:DUF4352 domain-containing protein [Streptomyces sp. NPDC001717]|uniref:DUF4352 domain-containing protein n=1 Tax=Streptomyces sp. NPDC001717 TaxID=3364604 RepID=UPI0036AEF0F3